MADRRKLQERCHMFIFIKYSNDFSWMHVTVVVRSIHTCYLPRICKRCCWTELLTRNLIAHCPFIRTKLLFDRESFYFTVREIWPFCKLNDNTQDLIVEYFRFFSAMFILLLLRTDVVFCLHWSAKSTLHTKQCYQYQISWIHLYDKQVFGSS